MAMGGNRKHQRHRVRVATVVIDAADLEEAVAFWSAALDTPVLTGDPAAEVARLTSLGAGREHPLGQGAWCCGTRPATGSASSIPRPQGGHRAPRWSPARPRPRHDGDRRHPRPGPPQDLERLIGFVNTNEPQLSQDLLRDPEQTRSWLATEGFEVGKLNHDDWAAIIAFREGVRAAAAANNGSGVDTDAVAGLRQAIDRLGFTVRAGADAHLEVASTTPSGRALAPLVGALMAAQADGSWPRVKACARDSCRWLFYDTTRNHSRTWCTNTTCGSREKAKRAYRRQLAKRQA